MTATTQLLTFNLEGRHYGLPLDRVERVIRAVEPTPLPRAPETVMGIINLRGKIIPVFNLRRRFRFADRDLDINDCFVIAAAARGTVALAVDSSDGVIERTADQITPAGTVIDRPEQVQGIVCLKDELLLIQDLDRFLTSDQEQELEDALAKRPSDAN
jgi:purine-binding chemotaxis protein CheW